MDAQRHYPKAPITEAVIDFQVKLPDGVSVTTLEQCGTREQQEYPKKELLSLAVGQLEVGKRVAASATSEPVGFMFRSADGKQVFQARVNGFTFSRLAPYERWEPFRAEAHRLWNLYREVAKPLKVTRLAVRYINRLDLPLPLSDLKDYLLTSPEVAPGLPQSLAGFFMQLRIPHEDIHSTLLLSETIIEPNRPGVCSIVLDIDLFRDTDLPGGEDGIWQFLESLHERKNQVFESCVTNKARELFK